MKNDEVRKAIAQYALAELLQKAMGEGSRGGKVIGHTKSGKPIYANSHVPKKGSQIVHPEEHKDAADAHNKEVWRLLQEGKSSSHQKVKGHMKARDYHRNAEEHLNSVIPKGKTAKVLWFDKTTMDGMVEHNGKTYQIKLAQHGDKAKEHAKIADKLLENGFMTISFDAPAHGKSEGKETLMNEFITVSEFLEKKYGPFEYAIGHSLGGMTVLNSIKQG